MKSENSESIGLMHSNFAFGVLAVVTAAILSVPLVAMQFSESVDWGLFDFLVMAVLISSIGSVFILLARSFPAKHRPLLFALCALLFLFVWAELAVGIFTNFGS